jgi:hypothetical protein
MRATVPIKSNDVNANQVGSNPRQITPTNNSASNETNGEWQTLSLDRTIAIRNSNLLSDEIAPGIIVTHTSGKAKIHVLKTGLTNTLSDLKATSSNLINILSKHHEIQGSTPSYKAMRVMFTALLRNPTISLDDKLKIKELRSALEQIDLNNISSSDFDKKIKLNIDNKEVDLQISLKKVNPLIRIFSVFSSDLEPADKMAKYNYNIKLSLSEPNQSSLQHTISQRLNQFKSIGIMLSPMAGALWLRAAFLPNKLVPSLFENNFIQGIFEFGSELLPLSVVGATCYFIFDKFLKRNL